MKNHKLLFFISIALCFVFQNIQAQAIWPIQDPNGNNVLIEDSSFMRQHGDWLIFYAIDQETGLRNLLVADTDTSYWLFDTGFNPALSYTDFINRKRDEIVFGIGGIWYISRGTPSTTQVFYDNHNPNNGYSYYKISEFTSFIAHTNNLVIEAIEKSSGDTLTLYHTTSNSTTNLLDYKVRIIEGTLPDFGPWNGKFFLGYVYNEDSQSWGSPGIYRELITDLHLLLTIEPKDNYEIDVIYLGNVFLTDEQESGEKNVYQYDENLDSLVDVTQTKFPNYKILDFFNVKWPYWGPDFPLNPPYSFNEGVWKGEHSSGEIRYFLLDVLGLQWEITELRNQSEAEFIFSSVPEDSIYYYNYDDSNHGFVRSNFLTHGTKKESTSIPFDSKFKLRGYNGEIYFGRYNPFSGQIEAISKDFSDNGYRFLESASGQRISNPVDFTFFDGRVIVHSRTAEGVELMVFDPDAIVSTNQVLRNAEIKVYPNPTSNQIEIKIGSHFQDFSGLSLMILDSRGIIINRSDITSDLTRIELSQYPKGLYRISIIYNNGIIGNSTFIVAE